MDRHLKEEFFHGYTPVASGAQVYLERPRINRLLEKAVQKPLVTVVAGPGFGKTHAVYAYARKANVRTAWIQISEQDNDAAHFWKNFLSTIPVISFDRAQKLKKLEFPATGEQIDRYFKLSEGEALPNEKYLFVFDDLHLVTDRTVLCFLERRIAALLPNVTFVLISRKELPFNMEKPASRKLLARISGEELRFTQDEMISCFRLWNLSPGPQTAASIYQHTEGWAFAVRVAALSLGNDSSGAAFVPQALRSNTWKLIESEIMASLSPGLRRFLIKLPLIENFNPDLLKEISGDSSLVKEMEEIGSFIRFDNNLNSYRIHYLFMDYLRERQNELSREEKKDVWAKAARWCMAHNQKMNAVANYEKTGDYNAILDVLYSLPQVLSVPMASFVFDLFERLPETVYRDFPMYISARARALISLGRYEQGRKELLEVLPALGALPESPQKHRVIAACNMLLGFIEFILSAYTKDYGFIHFFKTAAAESGLSGYVVKAPRNGINIGFHVCRVIDPSPEELEKFIAMVGEMVPCSAAAMGGCQSGMYELARGELAFYRGSLAEAEKFFHEAVKTGREKEQYEIANRSLFYLLRIYLARGNIDETENILSRLEAELEEPFYLNRYFHYDIVTGWFYIQTGRKHLAASWLKSDYLESDLNARGHGLETLVKAKYCFSENRYPAALAFLENQDNMDVFIMGRVEMKALEAVCRFRQQDKEGAYRALEEARALASPAGLFMPFTELGKDMRTLAEAAARDGAPGIPAEWLEETRRNAVVYAKKLYLQAGRPRAGKESPKARLLSYREMNVLTGLSQGLTREEIASAASISPNTVKSAAKSIYNKLGALNQADAVRIASARGILP